MRVNVYAEEITNRIELVEKTNAEGHFVGIRFYLELPVTQNGSNISGPFIHRPGDDDSAAITFWGKRDFREALVKAVEILDQYYIDHPELFSEENKQC